MLVKEPEFTLEWSDVAPESTHESALEPFRDRYEALYKQTPLKAVLLCLEYMATNGIDPVSRLMSTWVTRGTMYVTMLFDPEFVSIEAATKAVPALEMADGQFRSKFTRVAGSLKEPSAILRAMRLVEAFADYSFVIWWLRGLSNNADPKVRAGAARLLCKLRPTKGVIERQLHSQDPRIRAGALETLWNSRSFHSDEETWKIYHRALDDRNHRVIANALVGLYRLGETQILDTMIELSRSNQHLLRAAIAWALAEVNDPRAQSTLQELTKDRSFTVRKHSTKALQAMLSLEPVSPA